jgi:hypothetical protein
MTVGTLEIIVEDRGVEAMLLRLDTAFSPTGLATFLASTVDPYIRQRAEARFAAEGDDVTGKWVPLAAATQDIRSSMGYGPSHPINRRTGELEDYIVNAPHDIMQIPEGASISLPGHPPSNPELAEKVSTAQQGKKGKGRRDTPARPVMGLNERDTMFVVAALSFYTEKALGAL